MTAPNELLTRWIERRLDPTAARWLRDTIGKVTSDDGDGALYRGIGFVSRRIPRDDLGLDAGELANADAARTGWDPSSWSLDQAVRVHLLLSSTADPARLAHRLDRLCVMGAVQELVAYYQGLPLYPEPQRYVARGAEGLRSNMAAVFNAVAHRNPFPSEHFEQGTWNHMVLKALFIDSPLWPMVGLEQRANAELTRMLCDYAHERWAASRTISPELWRCVGAHPTDQGIEDLARALADADPRTQRGAAVALSRSGHPRARELLATTPALAEAVERGTLTWDTLRAQPSEAT